MEFHTGQTQKFGPDVACFICMPGMRYSYPKPAAKQIVIQHEYTVRILFVSMSQNDNNVPYTKIKNR